MRQIRAEIKRLGSLPTDELYAQVQCNTRYVLRSRPSASVTTAASRPAVAAARAAHRTGAAPDRAGSLRSPRPVVPLRRCRAAYSHMGEPGHPLLLLTTRGPVCHVGVPAPQDRRYVVPVELEGGGARGAMPMAGGCSSLGWRPLWCPAS